jgi:hypothetical protein
MATKTMTLRLPLDQALALEAIARSDEMPVSEAVREAIDAHIEARRNDAAFRERLSKRIEQDREILERLTGDSSGKEPARRAVQRAKAAVQAEVQQSTA